MMIKLESKRKTLHKFVLLLCTMGFVLSPALSRAQETPRFKPGFNFYKPAQDIEIGKQSVAQIEKEVPLLKDAAVENYISTLGHHLVELAPGNKEYPWTFKVVNSQDINAFALPGGYVYINRGVLESAENEGQLAGVISHEMGHVVMRHGTHRALQARLGQGALGVLGGLFGGGATGEIAQVGAGFLANSVLLKNSRGAESQADEVGTYMLYEAGYDPHSMAVFFDIIAEKNPQRTAQFFSDHPNPDNRVKRVNKLIAQLGPSKQTRNDSPEFQSAKNRIVAMPAPPKSAAQPAAQPATKPAPTSSVGTPALPSSRRQQFKGAGYSIEHPENWDVQQGESSVTIAPAGGVFRGEDGEWAQAYGASVMRLQSAQGQSLEDTTGEMIKSWQHSNPAMRVMQQKHGKVSGRAALSTTLENDSPLAGQKETVVMVAVDDPKGVLAVLFIAPQSDYRTYQPTFSAMLKSLEVD
jgi:Zn-dependent protease with chaperone function